MKDYKNCVQCGHDGFQVEILNKQVNIFCTNCGFACVVLREYGGTEAGLSAIRNPKMLELEEFLESLTAWCEKHQVKDGDVILMKDYETMDNLMSLVKHSSDRKLNLPDFTFIFRRQGCDDLEKQNDIRILGYLND